MRELEPSASGDTSKRTKFCESCKKQRTPITATRRRNVSLHQDSASKDNSKFKCKVKTKKKCTEECKENISTDEVIQEIKETENQNGITSPSKSVKKIKKTSKIPRAQKRDKNLENGFPSINGADEILLLLEEERQRSGYFHWYWKADEESVMAALGTQLRSSNTSNGGISRLSLMQAKFQEKLMLEKESRLLEMAARQEAEREDIINRVTRTSASSLSSSMSSLNSSGAGQGRVRKMFEERRANSRGYHQSPKGYDKSFPLDPVKRDRDNGRPPKGGRGQSMDRAPAHAEDPLMNRSKSQVAFQRVNRGDSRAHKQPKPQPRPFPTHHKSASSLMEGNSMYNGHSRGPSPAPPSSTKSSPGPRGQPLTPQRKPTPRNPPPQQQKKSNKSNFLTVNGNNDGRKSRSRSPSPSPTPSRESGNKGFLSRLGIGSSKPSNNNSLKPPSTGNMPPRTPSRLPPKDSIMINNLNPLSRAATPSPRAKTPLPSHLKRCQYCERNFDADRIQKHEDICKKQKTVAKKRKIFDPVKMRTKGTEAEKYVARGDHLKEAKKKKKKDWRKEHEAFIQTVRAAKGMTGYVAPPVDTSDYVECPHCGRKFSEKVADRHIPLCVDIQSNKANRRPDPRGPTPAAPPRRRR